VPFIRLLSICAFLLFLAPGASALTTDRNIHQLAHRAWGEKEGYPGRAEALAQTADGFLWIGTAIGLFRFDGVRFERYVQRSGDRLPSGPVRGLLALGDGSLWIAYRFENTICVLRKGAVKCYGKNDGVASNATAIIQDREGALWASIETGVIRFNGTRWEHIGADWNFPEEVPENTSDTLFVDSQGTLWAGVNHTILYLKRGSKQFAASDTHVGWSAAIVEAPDGTIWLADPLAHVRAIGSSGSATGDAIARCEAETPTKKLEQCRADLPVINITEPVRLLFDRGGSLWVATDTSGVSRIPRQAFQRNQTLLKPHDPSRQFTATDGLSADNCGPMLEDREGSIWVATRDGLDQFRDTALAPIMLPTSLYRTAIAPADNGDIWVVGSYAYAALVRADSSEIALVSSHATDVHRDPSGVVWIVGTYALEQWKHGKFVKVASAPDGVSTTAGSWRVAGDRFGTLWAFSQGRGFLSLEHGRWKTWATPADLAKQSVASMYADSAGRIWVATYEGDIITMDKGIVVDYSVRQHTQLRDVKVFAEHAPQEIWAGGGGGLVLIDRGSFRAIRAMVTESFDDVTGIVDAGSDGLWLNTADAIVHVSQGEIDQALRDPSYRFQCERFDSSDGLPGRGEPIYPYSKAIRGTDGKIWFTATKGVAWIDPKRIPKNTVPPPVTITSLSADGSALLPFEGLRLPAHTANLQINYSALSLSVPERVRFRTKLDGRDTKWQDAGTRRQAFYTDLRPGTYRFHVIASNSDGVWTENGASVAFNVAPAWYQTRTFAALATLCVGGILSALYRMRVRHIARTMRRQFDERLAERTRMARELHDTFVQTIQASKLVADDALEHPGDAAYVQGALGRLSQWLDRAVQESRVALHSLRASTTEVNDLADAFRRATTEDLKPPSMAISFSVVGDAKDIHPIVRDEIYRIGYEAIRNAVTHSTASHLDVELRYGKDLTVRVTDNGVGIDPTVARRGKDGHFGLQSMRERAGRIGARLDVVSSTAGTEVMLVVPGRMLTRPDAVPAAS
jgi:signal transduction histidine kinase/ligand-binding sensor domain-containing protein